MCPPITPELPNPDSLEIPARFFWGARRPGVFSLPTSSSQRFTFQALNQWVQRYASLLHRSGIQAGDRVCLYLANSPQLIVALFGNHLLGAISVPVNSSTPSEEFRYLAEKSDFSALISDQECGSTPKLHIKPSEFWEALDGETASFPENTRADAPALLCFTSGTTARSKGVVLTHQNIKSNLGDLIQVWGLDGTGSTLAFASAFPCPRAGRGPAWLGSHGLHGPGHSEV